MTDYTGLIVQGDDDANSLEISFTTASNGDLNLYNIVYAGAGDDQVSGRIGGVNNAPFMTYGAQLFGEDGNDTLIDSLGQDTLSGGAGDDILMSYQGHDFIDGGDGVDTLQLAATATPDAVTVVNVERLQVYGPIAGFDLNQFDFIIPSNYAGLVFTEAASLQHPTLLGTDWTISGSRQNDVFDVSSSRGGIRIWSSYGNDIVIAGMGNDNIRGEGGDDTLTGGGGRDAISGGTGDDVIFGGTNNDYINERSGNNTIHGGEGDDAILSSQGTNVIFGEGGNDTIRVSMSDAYVDGGTGNDSLSFRGDSSTLAITATGGMGDDVFTFVVGKTHAGELHGGLGNDTLDGGNDLTALHVDGIETLHITSHRVTITADLLSSFKTIESDKNFGLEIIRLSEKADLTWHTDIHKLKALTLIASSDSDHIDLAGSMMDWTVRGGTGDDTILGGMNTDALHGGAGDDVMTGRGRWSGLSGEQGNDTLLGFSKNSYLSGGSGDDVLVSGGGLSQVYGGSGNDHFVFGDPTGGAILHDFDRHGKDTDIIDFSEVSTVKNFHDLMTNHATAYPKGILISFGTSEIALLGVHPKDLHASDFIF